MSDFCKTNGVDDSGLKLNDSILINEEIIETCHETTFIRTLSGIKIRTFGEGLTQTTRVFAGKNDDRNDYISKTKSVFSGTPYEIITTRFERWVLFQK